MVRPIKYVIVKEHEDTKSSKLSELPLNAVVGIVDKDIPGFKSMGINNIPDLANSKFSKLKGKKLSDFKVNRGISFAIDVMIQAKEPGVHYEIMPIDEMLDKGYEETPATELAQLSTVAIEGVASGNADKLKKAKVASTIKELAEVKLEKITAAGLRDWEAEKFSQFAKWIMEYAKENTKKTTMDNIDIEFKGKILIIKFDITKEFGKSKTGKTTIVATSRGGRRIKGTDFSLGMFAYKYPSDKKEKDKKQENIQNIDIKLDGNIATLIVDTSKDFGTSASGKSIIIASSRGNRELVDTKIYLGLNVYKKKK